MKYNIFDVVKLIDGSKAIIVKVNIEEYIVKIVEGNNENQLFRITENEIANPLFMK